MAQWVDMMVNAVHAAVGAAGIWLAFKAQSQAEMRRNQKRPLTSQRTFLLSQQNIAMLTEFLTADAQRVEQDYGLNTR